MRVTRPDSMQTGVHLGQIGELGGEGGGGLQGSIGERAGGATAKLHFDCHYITL